MSYRLLFLLLVLPILVTGQNCSITEFHISECAKHCVRGEVVKAQNCVECWKNDVENSNGTGGINCWGYCIDYGYDVGMHRCKMDKMKIVGLIVGLLCIPLCVFFDVWMRRYENFQNK